MMMFSIKMVLYYKEIRESTLEGQYFPILYSVQCTLPEIRILLSAADGSRGCRDGSRGCRDGSSGCKDGSTGCRDGFRGCRHGSL